jgi:hypothetical protein
MQRDSSVDLPAVTVIEITDPSTANEGLELIDLEAVQLEPLPLRARRVIVRLDAAATVAFHSTNRRLRTVTRVHDGLLAYVTFGPQAHGTVNGLPVRPGLMLAAPPAADTRFVVDPGWESLTFLLSPEDVRAHLAARHREHEFHLPNGVEVLQADRDGARGLRRMSSCSRRSCPCLASPDNSSPPAATARGRPTARS